MIANSKPELCEVCGETAEKPRWIHDKRQCPSPTECLFHEHNELCDEVPKCHPCTAPSHSQADKHKRVAERLWMEPPIQPNAMGTGKQVLEVFERILREEYPE